MEQVSVEQALQKGKFLLKTFPVLLMALCMITIMLLAATGVVDSGLFIAVGFASSFVLAWLCWAIAVTHWRIWAHERVRNIHELMALAEHDQLIWRKGSWFERTEIRTRAQRDKLELMQARRDKPDERTDDPSVPLSTEVSFSRAKASIHVAFGMIFLGAGLWRSIADVINWWFGGLLMALGGWMAVDGGRKLLNRVPQLTIDAAGITHGLEAFNSWGTIANERVVIKGSGRSARTLLCFEHPDGQAEIDIGDLSISKNALRHAMKVHRLRWEVARAGS